MCVNVQAILIVIVCIMHFISCAPLCIREDWKPVLTINSIVYGLQFLFLVSCPAMYTTVCCTCVPSLNTSSLSSFITCALTDDFFDPHVLVWTLKEPNADDPLNKGTCVQSRNGVVCSVTLLTCS